MYPVKALNFRAVSKGCLGTMQHADHETCIIDAPSAARKSALREPAWDLLTPPA